jgi:hypothetical protein
MSRVGFTVCGAKNLTEECREAIGEMVEKAGELIRNMRIVGVDTGVNTGLAVWDCHLQQFESIETTMLHKAFDKVRELRPALVRVEDARLRKNFKDADIREEESGSGVREGVGSVKRDARAWQDFLTDEGIPFEMVSPAQNKTKLSPIQFKNLTKWLGVTSEHGRDAGMLVFGITLRNLKNLETMRAMPIVKRGKVDRVKTVKRGK